MPHSDTDHCDPDLGVVILERIVDRLESGGSYVYPTAVMEGATGVQLPRCLESFPFTQKLVEVGTENGTLVPSSVKAA